MRLDVNNLGGGCTNRSLMQRTQTLPPRIPDSSNIKCHVVTQLHSVTYQMRLDCVFTEIFFFFLHPVPNPHHRFQLVRNEQVDVVGAQFWDRKWSSLPLRDSRTNE